jgi:hypothetical protein
MTNRTNTYYTIRSIVRFIVKGLRASLFILAGALAFIGVHAAAASFWTALALSAVLWVVYIALVRRDSRKLAR